MKTLKFTAAALLFAFVCGWATEQATEYLADRFSVRNNGPIRHYEATPNGTNYMDVKYPASLAANQTFSWFDPDSITIADVAGAGEASYTITTLGKDSKYFTCSDTSGGCGVYLSDTGAFNGARLYIVNIGAANDLTIREVDGVSETAGTLTLSQDRDAVTFQYVVDRWVQMSAVINN